MPFKSLSYLGDFIAGTAGAITGIEVTDGNGLIALAFALAAMVLKEVARWLIAWIKHKYPPAQRAADRIKNAITPARKDQKAEQQHHDQADGKGD